MPYKYLLALLLIFSSSRTHAELTLPEFERVWLELGAGFHGFHTHLRATNKDNTGWSLNFSTFVDNVPFGSSIRDRATGELVSPRLSTLGVTRLWSKPYGWGYSDFGIGLGVGQHKLGENCETRPGYLINTKVCDIEEGFDFGIPLHASTTVGKYIGIGLSLNAFIGTSSRSGAIVFVFPLGKFTK